MFWANLRELFKASNMSKDIDEYWIEIYKEFNALMPEESITKVVD